MNYKEIFKNEILKMKDDPKGKEALIYYKNGIICLKKGDYLEARNSFQMALIIKPDFSIPYSDLILMNVATGKCFEERLEIAYRDYLFLKKLNPMLADWLAKIPEVAEMLKNKMEK